MSVFSRAIVATTLALLPASAVVAQDTTPRMLSPRDSAAHTIGDARLVIDYGRPSKRRREIFGSLVPYGAVWRTGANQATHLRSDRDVMIGSVRVPRGTYTLWTIPNHTGWTLIVNRQTGQWGTEYDPSQDLGRIPMEVASLDTPVEQFTIALASKGDGAGLLSLSWDTTQASVPIRSAK
ncbi:MAG: DUF2911 domain-containing protein [Gemmatimonadaceae bacterium]